MENVRIKLINTKPVSILQYQVLSSFFLNKEKTTPITININTIIKLIPPLFTQLLAKYFQISKVETQKPSAKFFKNLQIFKEPNTKNVINAIFIHFSIVDYY